jgi:hypothetical protein
LIFDIHGKETWNDQKNRTGPKTNHERIQRKKIEQAQKQKKNRTGPKTGIKNQKRTGTPSWGLKVRLNKKMKQTKKLKGPKQRR